MKQIIILLIGSAALFSCRSARRDRAESHLDSLVQRTTEISRSTSTAADEHQVVTSIDSGATEKILDEVTTRQILRTFDSLGHLQTETTTERTERRGTERTQSRKETKDSSSRKTETRDTSHQVDDLQAKKTVASKTVHVERDSAFVAFATRYGAVAGAVTALVVIIFIILRRRKRRKAAAAAQDLAAAQPPDPDDWPTANTTNPVK